MPAGECYVSLWDLLLFFALVSAWSLVLLLLYKSKFMSGSSNNRITYSYPDPQYLRLPQPRSTQSPPYG
jgi:hypothetical protein